MATAETTAPASPSDRLVLKNELANGSSLYLRSHQHNPVAWQEWSSATVDLARKHQRLIFLSIGYSACHWCHVMEQESFSSPEVAEILNNSFIPVKLDRESRPDLDDIYMNYVTATTGSGGWPLNVFLTPLLQPVFGGTYWPGPSSGTTIPADTEDRPLTFLDVLNKMQDIWQNERDRCLQSAADITRQLQAFAAEGIYAHNSVHVRGTDENEPLEPLDLDLIDDALSHYVSRYDRTYGGFIQSAQGPKFATPPILTFLLRIGASITRPSTHTRLGFPSPIPAILGKESCTTAASMALFTLLSMSRSALRDQLGHGFHRYSVTRDWNLPHFEKIIDDNAQLLSAYCDAWALGRDPEILGTIYDLVEYFTSSDSPIVRPEGGWYTSEDADSSPVPNNHSATDGHYGKKEGAFYVWTMRELITILGDHEAAIFARHFGIKEHGNIPHAHDPNDDFLSQNTLFVDATPSVLAKEFGIKENEIVAIIKQAKTKLKEHRETKRGKPEVDDKVVVAYNALVISALARAANTLFTIDEERARRCKDAAIKAVIFIKEHLFNTSNGKLTRVFSSAGNASTSFDKDVAFIDDYAYLTQALIKVYDITIDRSYLSFAFKLQETLDRDFHASPHGGYFQAAKSELTNEKGIRSPSTLSPLPSHGLDKALSAVAHPTTLEAALEQKEQLEREQAGKERQTQSQDEHQARPADQILNLKPGTDNSLPSPNGVIAMNLLYLASYASSLDTFPIVEASDDAPSSTAGVEQTDPLPSSIGEEAKSATTTTMTTSAAAAPLTAAPTKEATPSRSEALSYRAKKTIDSFAPEIIQHPFLYITFLGAIILDTVGVKSLLTPASMTDSEIESRGLRGFGRTVVRFSPPTSSGTDTTTTSGGIKDGEVIVCTKGVCRILRDGELDDLGEYVDEDEAGDKQKDMGFPAGK